MIIKRFEAENMTKALEDVKAILGEEAVILHTRRRQRKDANGALVSYVEVMAAVDPDSNSSTAAKSTPNINLNKPNKNKLDKSDNQKIDVSEVLEELHGLRRLVENLAVSFSATSNPNPYSHLSDNKDIPLGLLDSVLNSLGLPAEIKRRIAISYLSKYKIGESVERATIIRWLYNYGLSLVNVIEGKDYKAPMWWAFVGPTGVGKTTTLAKLAADLAIRQGKNGLLVSIDTYRLAGIDQLRRYAELIDIPFEVAQDPMDLARIFSLNKDKDFIFVDTTGRSPWDSRNRKELRRFFDAIPELSAQVLLCATLKHEDLVRTITLYKDLPVSGWILSKIDETKSYGVLATPVLGLRLPISYLTTGQRVPEDIECASAKRLVSLILGLNSFGIKKDGKMINGCIYDHPIRNIKTEVRIS